MAASFYWFVKIPHPTFLNKPVTIPVKNQSQKNLWNDKQQFPHPTFFDLLKCSPHLSFSLKCPGRHSGAD